MPRTEASQDIQRAPRYVFGDGTQLEPEPKWAGVLPEAKRRAPPAAGQDEPHSAVRRFLHGSSRRWTGRCRTIEPLQSELLLLTNPFNQPIRGLNRFPEV
ncbi:hypothetical protein [Deinococcus ficus]|uniref:Uncharacterized protein n=1 Tax=Deinococcus ficus TaxID=317577 RepID=A0A221T134_9DEIO|nr:hypothetical protein [Deinococcus ficus]ASN82580.1 hypothetical protein DFI_15505 [Deinococcus ficus]